MNIEETLVILFGLVIIVQCFFMYVMSRRIRQLLEERDTAGFATDFTESELDEISRTVDEYKKHQN
ncbi:MAG: hypothetical protein WCK53_15390 [Methanomicrobiales archaeon]